MHKHMNPYANARLAAEKENDEERHAYMISDDDSINEDSNDSDQPIPEFMHAVL